MNDIIIIGDVHARFEEPFRSGINDFFEWLKENHGDDYIIQVGDLFHTSNPHNEIRSEILGHLRDFQHFIILNGNHDRSKRAGVSIHSFKHFPNILPIIKVTEFDIKDIKFLFIPYTKNKEYLEHLEGTYDYIITHITPPECAFSDEGIQLNLKGKYIHGHTHHPMSFTDKNQMTHDVIGVFNPTRYDERDIDGKIFRITKDKGIDLIEVPKFVTYEEVEFGDKPKNEKSIINVINAPDRKSVFNDYKGYYVRKAGIQLKEMEEGKIKSIDFYREPLENKFSSFVVDNSIDKDQSSTCFTYLEKAKEVENSQLLDEI